MTGPARAFRLWPYLLGILLGLCAGLVLFIYLGARHIDDRTRAWVITELSNHFDSQVELQSLHVETTPRMQVTGEGLTLRYRNRTDVPPLIQIARFSFNLGVLGIIHVPRHVKGVYVENMIITIPPAIPTPRIRRPKRPRSPASSSTKSFATTPLSSSSLRKQAQTNRTKILSISKSTTSSSTMSATKSPSISTAR